MGLKDRARDAAQKAKEAAERQRERNEQSKAEATQRAAQWNAQAQPPAPMAPQASWSMVANIAGIDETLERIKQEPSTPAELTKHLNEVLGTTWESDAQPSFRLQWLVSFGKAKRQGSAYLATAAEPSAS